MTTLDVRRLKLAPGEEHREEIDLDLPALTFGGERYIPVPEHVSALLVVDRAVTGMLFRLRFTARLHGPCHRCLGDAALDVAVDTREYQAASGGDEELSTPYLVDGELQLSDWARDAVALALPDRILCQPGCAGLCPECGENLNANPHSHEPEAADSRWAALESLRDQL